LLFVTTSIVYLIHKINFPYIGNNWKCTVR
jgi:hypothetical protein